MLSALSGKSCLIGVLRWQDVQNVDDQGVIKLALSERRNK